MILPFSTKIDGKETFFVEKIIKGLIKNSVISIDKASELLDIPISQISKLEIKPKLHTIREDKKNRWKVGTKIDFFINVRQKNMFRFAPVLPVVSTQKVEFIWKHNAENLTCLGITYDRTCTIMIDDKFYGDAYLLNDWVVSKSYNLDDFANNDGFQTIEDFFAYFNKSYVGKLIHWTDLKY